MASARIKPLGWAAILILGVLVVMGIGYFAITHGFGIHAEKSVTLGQGGGKLTGDVQANSTVKVAPIDPPSNEPANVSGPRLRILGYAWNGQAPLLFAIGGARMGDGSSVALTTSKGSLMAKHGVNLTFSRQDDNGQLQAELIKWAQEYSRGHDPQDGATFICFMGDATASFAAALNPQLRKLGEDYVCEVVGFSGFSFGEDKLMGPPAWLTNPQAARGAIVAAVKGDGDMNVAFKWARDNGIPINPSESTYDPDALNYLNPKDYVDAGAKYIAGFVDTRWESKNGKPTGRQVKVPVTAVASWTPVDVNIADSKGGLAVIASTRQYNQQMPCTIMGIRKWNRDHAQLVANMLTAIFEASDQIKTNPRALQAAAEFSATAYHEQTPQYWRDYYRGMTKPDAQGIDVQLGGSRPCNLADAIHLVGLDEGGENIFADNYQYFGDMVHTLFPDLIPTVPPVSEVLNTQYITMVRSATPSGKMTAPDTQTYKEGAEIARTVSSRAYNIRFRSGSAEFDESAITELEGLKRSAINTNLSILIDGYTDNVGGEALNLDLSQRRANAVEEWLNTQSPANFPRARMKAVGHGMADPVSPNSTEEGRAKNRRVVIVLGET